MLPNVVIMTPSNEKDMTRMLSTGLEYKGLRLSDILEVSLGVYQWNLVR